MTSPPAPLRLAGIGLLLCSIGVATAGCTEVPDLGTTISERATDLGYRCVDTIPAEGTADQLVNCGKEDDKVVFARYSSEDRRKLYEVGSADPDLPYTASAGTWTLAASDESDLDELVATLPR